MGGTIAEIRRGPMFVEYLYWFALSAPVVWVRELFVLFTYDDYLCGSGRHHASIPE
jgi:hypothetical protein